MGWYLIQTKAKLESLALQNLNNQGYQCFLPTIKVERLVQKKIEVRESPLFPRYLFINLESDFVAKSWAPIRSTKGVSKLVSFGNVPGRVDDKLVDFIRARECQEQSNIEPLLKMGQKLKILHGTFAGFESIYLGMDAKMRVMVLFDFMGKSVSSSFALRDVVVL